MPGHAEIPVLEAAGLRRFALLTASILAGLFGVGLPWILGLEYPRWPWVLAGALAAWGVAAPATLGPLYRGWMRFGLIMSRVTTPLVLAVVFFALFTPVACLMRLARRDPMARGFDRDAPSYRVPSEKPRRENMERPY